MQKSDLEGFTAWFGNYIAGFFGDDAYIDANLELKKVHTEYVVDEARYIADGLALDESDALVAETVALFHDLGRFEQFTKYQTYSDAKSINHSELAAEILRANGVLDGLCQAEKAIILTAVASHGLKDLPDGLDEKVLLHCRIVRDADKLDIYRVLLEKYAQYISNSEDFNLELEYPDEPWYSEDVAKALIEGKQVRYDEAKTLNDMKLLILAMIFDVNFRPSFVKIREKQYVQAFVDMLPMDDTINKVKAKLLDYIDEKMN